MATYTRDVLTIAEIIRLSNKKQLILQPKFQRRRAWDEKARSYLIDTVVRELPMPKIFLRRIVNPETKLRAYEVVDGQQRLDAIISFRKGNLTLSKKHNPNLGDSTFVNLPDPVQKIFLEYKISVELIDGASDSEIWGLFERLNTYTLTLNRQEHLNARYFGYFKQTAYQLAAEESALNAWKQLGIFRDRQIARMKEVEMTSDIMVAIVRGISDISAIPRAYKDFDSDFPAKESAMSAFRATLSFVTENLRGAVGSTRFRTLAWYYSLMVAIADAKVGIPDGNGVGLLQPKDDICRRMYAVDEALKQTEPPPRLADLYDTLSRATSHVRERRIRHSYFFKMLTLSKQDWRSYWDQLTATG
jgi:hypothetical protein